MEISKALIEERAREEVSRLRKISNLEGYSEDAFEIFITKLMLKLWVRTNEKDMQGGPFSFEVEFHETDDLQKTADVLEEEYMKKFLFKFVVSPSKKNSPKGFLISGFLAKTLEE